MRTIDSLNSIEDIEMITRMTVPHPKLVFSCVKKSKPVDLPLLMNVNTRTVLALNFLSFHHAVWLHHQISVWFDIVLLCVSPSSHEIYCKQMDKNRTVLT